MIGLPDFMIARPNTRAAMESAGIKVSPSPARIGKTLMEVLKR